MTHLSDYTYLDRLVCNIFALIWILYRIQTYAGIRIALSYRRFRKGELRPIITFLLLVSNVLIIVYDILGTTIKYNEGYVIDGDKVVARPKEEWSAGHLKILPISDSFIDFSFAFLTSSLFLFQATWNFIVQPYTKTPFMNSVEFHLYLVYSCLSFAAYALLQVFYLQDKTQSTIIPQMFFSSEALVLTGFTIINQIRLSRTLQQIEIASMARAKLEFSLRLNVYLGISIIMMGLPLFFINIDTLIGSGFAHNRLLSDVLMKLFNLGFSGTFIFLCMTLYSSYDYPNCGCNQNYRLTTHQFNNRYDVITHCPPVALRC